jgi:hypothetical protein
LFCEVRDFAEVRGFARHRSLPLGQIRQPEKKDQGRKQQYDYDDILHDSLQPYSFGFAQSLPLRYTQGRL